MKDRVHFFSVEDISIPYYFQMAEKVIEEYENGGLSDDVNDSFGTYH